MPRSSKSQFSGISIRADASQLSPITGGWTSWFQHFGRESKRLFRRRHKLRCIHQINRTGDAGETIFPPEFLSFILDAKAHDHAVMALPDENNELVTIEDTVGPQLSPRENLILRCLIAGDSNKCIARKIDIAQGTVKVHVKAILRKIRVQNRTQAAIWGMNNGSLERTANNKPPLSTSDMNKRLPKPVAEIPEIDSAKP